MESEDDECIRLMDYLGMTQEECAVQMGVARTTVQGIYTRARRRLAGALVEGRPLQIAGGNFELWRRAIPLPAAAPYRRGRIDGCAARSQRNERKDSYAIGNPL